MGKNRLKKRYRLYAVFSSVKEWVAPLKHVRLSLFLSLFFLSYTAHSIAKTQPHNLIICKFDERQYSKAIRKISSLQEFKSVKRSLIATEKKIVFGGMQIDKAILFKNHCHHMVTVYIDTQERFELWKIFLFRSPSAPLFFQNSQGEYVLYKTIAQKTFE